MFQWVHYRSDDRRIPCLEVLLLTGSKGGLAEEQVENGVVPIRNLHCEARGKLCGPEGAGRPGAGKRGTEGRGEREAREHGEGYGRPRMRASFQVPDCGD